MTVDEALAIVASKAAGRTRWEGSEPWVDEVLAAEVRRLRELDWQPIETADRNSSEPVDIWVVPPDEWLPNTTRPFTAPQPHRVAHARPTYGAAWESPHGLVVTGIRTITGVIDPDDTSPAAYRATHWRRIAGPGEIRNRPATLEGNEK